MQVGSHPAAKMPDGLANGATESGSPTGTVSLTSPPNGFGVTPVVSGLLFGSMNARLSFELAVTTSFAPGADSDRHVGPVRSVPQKSVGPSSLTAALRRADRR